MSVGSAPIDEDCAQVGSDNYRERARQECRALIGQMKRIVGEAPAGATWHIHANEHDFGTYYEACVMYADVAEAEFYAYEAEENLPSFWDDIALKELP